MDEIEVGARGKLQQIGVISDSAQRLEDFLREAEKARKLSRKERLLIVEQALLLLEMNYVHLPLKRAVHAIDPIQQLKLLKFRLSEMKESALSSEMQFHRRLLSIFGSARDLHTLYLLPDPYRDQIAYLPFLIEQCFERGARGRRVEKFLVTRVMDGQAGFAAGVEILYWNGVPIRRAIEINGESQAGSNREARFARGLDNLTIRPLDSSLPPDEMWVEITYRNHDGTELTHRQDWLVQDGGEIASSSSAVKESPKKRAAIDIKKTRINEVKRQFYEREHIRALGSISNSLYAQVRTVGRRDYGYIRLYDFDVEDSDKFIDKFVALITSDQFPQNGLIIDVRGNGGGQIRAGERLLQLFTPNRIKPEPFEFINTPLNLELCRRAPKSWNLRRWVDSITESFITGAVYSSGFPLNSEKSCNDIGQVYYGPVVLITDALSYSTTDIFAAGFQDNKIGEILGTSDNTGAGGGNLWWYENLGKAYGKDPQSPFRPLPNGADMVLAVRRSLRVGRLAGRPLEEIGITPDRRHFLTRRDILQSNQDLIRRAARLLKKRPVFRLSLKLFTSNGQRGVKIDAASIVPDSRKGGEISRLDIFLNGRPQKSIPAVNGAVRAKTIMIRRVRSPKVELEVEARNGDNKLLALSRKLV